MARLRDIHAVSSVPFGPNAPFTGAVEIELEDQPIAQGGFGAVYRIVSVDGRTIAGSLVKVMFSREHGDHAYETIQRLHEKLRKRFGGTLLTEHPELLGMPFLLFRARNDADEPVVGMALCDLRACGFDDMGSDAWDAAAYFRDAGPLEKLQLAYQFARTVDLLHSINFIHADLKDKSIFLDPSVPQLVLIDYDSGFHPEAQKAASTLGALGQWASAKVRQWISGKQSPGQLVIEERLEEERWAVASGVFELLSGVAPFFFLKDADDASIADYLRKHKWPEVDPASDLVNPANLAYHQALLLLLQELEDSGGRELVQAFRKSFNRGYYKPAARPSPGEWKAMLADFCRRHVGAPVVEGFQGDKATIRRRGEAVKLSWRARNYRAVLVNGAPVPVGSDSLLVTPNDSAHYTLTALSGFGTTEATFKVDAIKVVPTIHAFQASKPMRDSLDSVVLEWSVSDADVVRLLPAGVDVDARSSMEVQPVDTTTYELQAYGGFGELAVAHVKVEVLGPEIELFDWEVNLLEGIDNVDLKWKVRHGQEVSIEGVPGVHPPEGLVHVAIRTPTSFTLTAKGLFGSTSTSLKAFPFPVPVIEQMRLEYPALELATQVNIPPIALVMRDLDPSLLTVPPAMAPLDPGPLSDSMDEAWKALHRNRVHWLLSGRALWERITGIELNDHD